MSFLSPAYFAFFPVTVLIYFLLPQKCRNLWLLICSWFFYACAGPEYLPFLVGSSIAVYFTARRLEKRPQKALLVFMLALFIGLLTLFKYLGFAAGVIKSALAVLGLDWTAAVPKLLLPAGISFYFFAAMGYLIDVYRGKVPAEKDFVKSALFLSFFPSLLSGPIARADRLLPQFEQRHEFSWRDVRVGLFRFAYGAFLKLLIADRLAVMVDTVFASPQSFGSLQVIAAACAFSIQIYCDFAAYSHMAIGSARAMGFKLTENFNTPYFSRSVAEFWRRWHISLSTWFRDYLYIPLGGNRRGKARQILNLLAVWALTGLWHGASWNFVLWGLYFFVLLSIEKQIAPKLETLPFIVRNLVTMFFVLIGWVLFMNTSLSGIGSAFAAMFGGGTSFAGSGVSLQLKNSLPLLLTCLIGSSVLPRWFGFIWSGLFGMGRSDRRGAVTVKKSIYLASVFLFLILLLWLCTVSLVGSTSSPSMYAQF